MPSLYRAFQADISLHPSPALMISLQGLEYVFSFVWKPPILIAWKPRADLDRDAMDPARDTVVSSLYKSFGGALDKTAVYDEEDQLLILSDM